MIPSCPITEGIVRVLFDLLRICVRRAGSAEEGAPLRDSDGKDVSASLYNHTRSLYRGAGTAIRTDQQ